MLKVGTSVFVESFFVELETWPDAHQGYVVVGRPLSCAPWNASRCFVAAVGVGTMESGFRVGLMPKGDD